MRCEPHRSRGRNTKIRVRACACVRGGARLLSQSNQGSLVHAEIQSYRYPTDDPFDGEIPLPHLKATVSDHKNNPFGIQWQRYWPDAPCPDLVKRVAHAAFEVENLDAWLVGHNVIIAPNSPSRGVRVAFIEVNGAPIELMEVDRSIRNDDV